jgi:uncharacterized protein
LTTNGTTRSNSSSTDTNIDHRRVPNLRRFFARQGFELPLTKDPEQFQPGDIVSSKIPLPHIMIVSDKKGADGVPYVIHNIGLGAREEASLFEYPLTGHYRLKGIE